LSAILSQLFPLRNLYIRDQQDYSLSLETLFLESEFL
jgi:hypothetical protein